MNTARAIAGLAALGAVVVLAGCGGVLGGPETATSTARSPTPTAEPTEPPLETFEYPTGTSRHDINYTRLSGRHADVLAGQSYEYSEVEVGHGAFGHRQVNDVASDPGTEKRSEHLVRNRPGSNGTWANVTYDTYLENGTRYHRTNRSGNVTTYERNVSTPFADLHDPATGRSVGNGHLTLAMSIFEWEARDATTVRDRDAVRFETTAVDRNATNASFGHDSHATLVVSERGAILRLDLSLVTSPGTDRERTVEMTYRVESLGDASPTRPEWANVTAS